VYLGREPTDEETESETVMLQKKLKLLNERETATIRARFGLDDGTKKTLAEIGRKYGVTRERIRQIEKRAIQKLRSG
jgi:RNA polymerase primary sigma factor